ncbi:uncharacterized protein [Montipora capricornis]|uniref:uncharacterized protein n=1 Tax=Montipora capricornis TaxID=246305 RepID=UPI0035F19BF2
MWVYPRPHFWFQQLFLNRYQDHLWREHFRVSRDTFEHICGLVGPQLMRQNTILREAITVEKRLAVALWRLATGNSYRTVGLTFGIGRCTAMNVKDEFCSALMRRANDFIKFIKTETETSQAIQKFQDISHFPQVVGALDGSHIPIKAPKEDANEYVNRKSFHSIVLQGVADANGKFLHVSTGYAGSIHNARMLRMRSLLTAIEDGDILHSPLRRIGGMQVKPPIVADPAYKLTTWCMKPFPQTRTMTDSQRDFNKSLSSARVVVEQAFGLLKGRWRCLLDKLDESVDKVPSTIITCCILHNICLEVNDGTEIDVANDEDGFLGVPLPGHDINADGARLRNTIKDTLY